MDSLEYPALGAAEDDDDGGDGGDGYDSPSDASISLALSSPRRHATRSSPAVRSPHKITKATLSKYQKERSGTRSSPRKNKSRMVVPRKMTVDSIHKKVKRNNHLFHKDTPRYEYNGKTEFSTLEELDAAHDHIAKQHCGLYPSAVNEVRLVKKNWKPVSTSVKSNNYNMRRICRCAFNCDTNCPWCLEDIAVTRAEDPGKVLYYYIRLCTVDHNDHESYSLRKQGIPTYFKTFLTSYEDTPLVVVERIRNNDHMADEILEKRIKRWVLKCKGRCQKSTAPDGIEQNSWELLAAKVARDREKFVADQSEKDPMNASGNCPLDYYHEPFVVGKYVIEPKHPNKDSRCVIVISTKNLLLNTVRQRQCGMGFALSCDASYSHTIDQHFGLLPIMVTSPAQEGRLVATAIVNKEDNEIHEHIFRQIKDKVESLQKELVEKGIDHL